MPHQDSTELEKQLNKLNETMRRGGSFKATFMRGVVSGVGTAVGATVVAAIVITIVLKILQVVGVDRLLPENIMGPLTIYHANDFTKS